MRTSRRVASAIGAVALAGLVTACGGGGGGGASSPAPEDPPDSVAAEPSEQAPTAEPDPLAACLEGTWQLDTADFTSQAGAYLRGLGIPLEALDVVGGQQLTFAADGFVSQSTDLVWTASITGVTVSVPNQDAGEGSWTVEDDILAIEDWSWNVDPADAPPATGLPAGAEAPQISTFSLADVAVEETDCTSDTLTLRGSGAPLRGVFVRFGG